MSEIALYNTLRKIPEVSEAEAKEAVADVANSKEVVTKADIAKVDKTITELKAETKADIAELKAETKADIAELKAETKADIAELKTETKADIAGLETEMANLETRLTKLIYAVTAINAGVIIAAVGLMIKFL